MGIHKRVYEETMKSTITAETFSGCSCEPANNTAKSINREQRYHYLGFLRFRAKPFTQRYVTPSS